MTTTLIHILLLVAAVCSLAVILRWDMRALQHNNYSNSSYYNWITSSDEYLTIKRVTLLVVLIASVTSMAMASPAVDAILAVVLLAQAAMLARKKHDTPLVPTSRVTRLYVIELIVLLFIAAIVGILGEGLRTSAVAVVMMATFSYSCTLAANWMMQPIEQHMGTNSGRED